MKKVIAWMLVLALTAAVSIGATLAYLTDTDEDVNVMTLGKVKIDQLEYERIDVETKDDEAAVQEFHDNKPLLPAVTGDGLDYAKPGDTYVDWEQIGKDGYTSPIWNPDLINNEVDKMVFVKNKGDYDAYVRSVFAFEAGKYTTLDEFNAKVHLNLNETDWTWEWVSTPVTIGESTYFIATATYNKVLEPGALTEISLSQIALDSSATNEDVEAFGETYQVLVKSQGIQAAGFTDPDTALDEGFGVIDANNAPWETDNPIKGIDVRTALHYKFGDINGEKITGVVNNVIFALNKEYPEIVENYDGYLVDEEQDVPVYAHYVPNGSGYDIYFLADDEVFLPRDSSSLFRDMKALKSVDTHNMNVSRVENMYVMFLNCHSLTYLDTTDWDTSRVTNMRGVFNKCTTLEEIKGIESWDTSASTTMKQMFLQCQALESLDLSGWNVSNVTDTSLMFQFCTALKEVTGTGDWHMPKNTTMKGMFSVCSALESVDVRNWEVPNVTTTLQMFTNCTSLVSVPGSENWDFGSVTEADAMFFGCGNLESLDVSGWDTSNVKTFPNAFRGCSKLTELDVSNWDTHSVQSFLGTFEDCVALKKLDVSQWDVSNVTTFLGTFQNCTALTELDVSGWDTASAVDMGNMFHCDTNLEYLDVSEWDVSKVQNFSFMFASENPNAGDMKLQNLDLSAWNPASATNMCSMFYGCGQLTEVDMSGWNVTNLKNISHMFADCYKLEKVDFTGWNTTSLENMDAVFNNCSSLKSVDMSMFDTSDVVYFCQLFEQCYSLEEIKGLENWDTAKGTDFSEMFFGTNMKELNLSSFDMSSATITYSMFQSSDKLKTIYVGDGWNLSNATSHYDMFYACYALEGGNGTVYDDAIRDKTYGCVDTPETPGYLTYKAPADENP